MIYILKLRAQHPLYEIMHLPIMGDLPLLQGPKLHTADKHKARK